MSSVLRNERLDEAAYATLSNLGWALLLGLAPAVLTRRVRVLALSQVFSVGVATGLSWRDCQRILHARPAVAEAHESAAKD